jgi:O-antigen/teichoic acid export membrane protein
MSTIGDTADSGSMPSASETQRGSRRTLLGGGAVLILGFGLDQAIRFTSNILLAKLLYPEAFGLLALSMAFITALNLFSDLGIRTAIIQSPHGDDPAFLNTAWTLQNLRGLILWVCSIALAWPAAYWREGPEPRLLIIVPLLGLTAIFDGFASTKLVSLQRHMRQKQSVMFDLSCQILGVAVTLSWAFIDRSVWCLVAGPLTSSVCRSLGSHLILDGPRNRWQWDKPSAKKLAHVAGWSYFGTICTFLAGQTDRLVVGIRSLAELGVYHFAATLAQIPTALTYALSGRLLFPFYSKVVQSGGDLATVWRGPHRVVGLFAALLVTGIAASGPHLVKLIYDERYQNAGLFLPLLALGVWFQIFEGIGSALLFATGLNRTSAFSNFSKVVVLLLLVPAATYFHGTIGMIAAFVAGDLVRYAYTATALHRRGIPVATVDGVWGACSIVIAAAGTLIGLGLTEVLEWQSRRLQAGTAFVVVGLTVVVCWCLIALLFRRLGRLNLHPPVPGSESG